MGQDDFSLITDDSDRMAELTDAALSVIASQPAAAQEAVACERCGRCRDGDFANCKNTRSLAEASKAAIPFVAYAYSKGIDGAESAGRAIESALVASVDAATAWADGYASGVIDERTSDDNIGIAGFGAKIDPARANPYLLAAPVAAAPVDAPSIESAHAMGAKGAPANDAERLAFEAWMRGHCWALCATWDGAGYRSDAEQGGGYCPNAARTRMLWAAWRDRAALASNPAAPGIDLTAAEVGVIETLLALAYAVWNAADNGEDNGESLAIERSDFAAVDKALDALEELPDDQPGYAMEAAAKARWALRRVLSAPLIDASPNRGSDALARAYGYLWHVNYPEDIPTGHPYMSADRAAIEARKGLRDMLTHEQRGEGINWVRQKLLSDMQPTSHGAGVSDA